MASELRDTSYRLELLARSLEGVVGRTRPHGDPNVPVTWPLVQLPPNALPEPVWVDGTYPHTGEFVD